MTERDSALSVSNNTVKWRRLSSLDKESFQVFYPLFTTCVWLIKKGHTYPVVKQKQVEAQQIKTLIKLPPSP
ncbi:hypothetical protein F3157_03910 [Virgibacillus dakarensis]|nr:hypothetical protein [Virgibacillus dakarensis]